MRFLFSLGAVLLPFIASTAGGIEFDPEDEASIRSATRQYANGLMSLYEGDASGTAVENIGIWPQPHYWWEGGAAWGGMIEYSQVSGDDSHVKALQQALSANYGPDNDFILSYRKSQTGNDDQAFWALAVMSALEHSFPDPEQAPSAYMNVAVNAFNNIVGRWDTTTCDGGLKWQIYPENAYGYNYKNSISNGCAFALGARLARYTGNQTYADWAEKIYDWTKSVGLITDIYEVFDGTDDKTNCASVSDKTQWTYNNAMFLHGSAFMYDYTNGGSVWKERTSGFLDHAELLFFKPFENSTDIMYEWACETGESGRHCNLDQQSFKAYLSRFMAKTAMMAPFTKDTITKYLKASAIGAAKSCSGGADGATCGSKWYTGAWDGMSGVGQQLAALEVTQALLMLKQNFVPAKYSATSPQTSSAAAPKSSSTSIVKQTSSVNIARPSSTVISKPSSTPDEEPASPTNISPSSTKAAAPIPSTTKDTLPAESTGVESTSASSIASSSDSSSPTTTIRSSAIVTSQSFSAATSTITSDIQPSETETGLLMDTVSPVVTCTPSLTTTVWVPAVSQTSVSTTLVSVAPPANSSSPSSSGSTEFQGAAMSVRTSVGSIVGAAVVVLAAGLL
ncbi:glycoside hydrolase family 76 protein [Dothidotthia symphoricarpi CBS 119687]|uniref:mannan endo-1,6-alpha-mannosidase n=1 Tax=Dothidotthia symphoricarpi CBS 119687 TaxID=1392245 RepID=A0A6A6AED8_9PLEO|nr:glycoside hydrolase family 76 protein [Dothidotthia symphoricarpi CBS 119687]KAF2130302.1 glycoside hydrolase family 76 protein [Dothidotthia symphoricarpi CBS 119687]